MAQLVYTSKLLRWHNPFPVKKYGLDTCLQKFKEYIVNNKDLMDQLNELDGKELGCWYVPDHKCHGHILIELIEQKLNNHSIHQ